MRLKLAIVCEDQPVSPFTLFMIDQMCESNIACIHYCCGEKYVPWYIHFIAVLLKVLYVAFVH